MPSLSNNRLPYRRDIDGLRALAVLAVLAFHFSRGRIRGGFVGVDIFFVISGFLISSIIYNELESGSFSITEFYVRRVRRIYPALFVVLAAVCILGWFLLLPSGFVVLGKQILGGSTFVANFVLWSQSGYFSPDAAQKPLLHLWSLGVEEQYYLIFPLICVLFYRARSRWALPTAFLVIAVTSMTLNVAFVARYSSATYFLPFSRLWELFVGAGLSLAMQRSVQGAWENRLSPVWRSATSVLGLLLLTVSIFGIDQNNEFPGWWALLPTIGTALCIAAGPDAWCNRNLLALRPAVFIGLISYPLYLWHWPIFSFMNIANTTLGVEFSRSIKVGVALAPFLLAYLTYRFVELPIRRAKAKSQRRNGALWLLGSVAMTGAFGLLVVVDGGFPARLPSAVVALDHNYEPEIARAWREGTCFLRPEQSAESFSKTCLDVSTSETEQPLVLVWGDSHAADLFPGFRALQQRSGVRLAQYTSSLCAPVIGMRVRERPACYSINRAVLDRIRILKPEVVVLSAQWDNVGADRRPASDPGKLLQTIRLVKDAGVERVVLVGSAPAWTSALPGLLVEEVQHNPNRRVPQRLTRSLLEPHDDTLLRATAEEAGAVYLPVFDSLCDQTSCLATTGDTWNDVIDYDNAHFTEHGSVVVAERIWQNISRTSASSGQIEN